MNLIAVLGGEFVGLWVLFAIIMSFLNDGDFDGVGFFSFLLSASITAITWGLLN